MAGSLALSLDGLRACAEIVEVTGPSATLRTGSPAEPRGLESRCWRPEEPMLAIVSVRVDVPRPGQDVFA